MNFKQTGSSGSKPSHADEAVFHVTDQYDGKGLSTLLKGMYPDASWGQVRRWIQRRFVQVNGNLCMDAGRRLKTGDVVKRLSQAMPKPVEARDLKLAYLDEHLLVVEKPAGITSVRHVAESELPPRRKQLQPTLDELLPEVLARVQRMEWPLAKTRRGGRLPRGGKGKWSRSIVSGRRGKLPPQLRVYAVHRLDRNTSGLMVFARTPQTQQRLVAQFRRRAIHREYVAVCHGHVQPQRIESTFVRDRGDGLRGTLLPGCTDPRPDLAQRAVTHIVAAEHIGSPPGYSLVRCQLETGRTHQIRIHLAELGHPICGEPLYTRMRDGTIFEDTSNAPRQALHAHRMALRHPITGEELTFYMPLPPDLASWMRSLRRQVEEAE